MNSKDSIAHIATLNSVEEVRAFVGDDTRKTVIDAGEARIAALEAGEGTGANEQEQPEGDSRLRGNDGATQEGDTEEDPEEDDTDEDLEEEEDEDEEEATPSTPSTNATPPAPAPPARPAPTAKVDTMKERREGHREHAARGGAQPPFTPGKGSDKRPQPGSYKVKGADQKGNGKIHYKGTEYLRRDLEKDQALCAELFAKGVRYITKL